MLHLLIKLLLNAELYSKIVAIFIKNEVKKSYSSSKLFLSNFITSLVQKIKELYLRFKEVTEIRVTKTKLIISFKYRDLKNKLREKKQEVGSKVKQIREERKKEHVLSNSSKYVELIGNHPTVYNTLTDIVDVTMRQLDYEINVLIKNDIYILRPDSEEFVTLSMKFVDRFRMNTGDVVYKSFCDWFGSEEKLLELITFLFYRKIATTLSSALETTLNERFSGE